MLEKMYLRVFMLASHVVATLSGPTIVFRTLHFILFLSFRLEFEMFMRQMRDRLLQ